jgi:GT2 family glycosyltransferase
MDCAEIVVIILNWNGYSDTAACVDSLSEQTYPNFRAILVDNGSTLDEKQKLEELCQEKPWIELIQNKENLGFTKANNIVVNDLLNRDDWQYIALLNNDTTVEKTWLSQLVQCAEETTSDIVGSKLVFMDNPSVIDNIGHYMLNTGEILPLGNGDNEKLYQQRLPIFGACAGAMLIKRQLIENIGMFDPFFETGYEDAEFGARACLLGYRCTFEPKAIVKHRGSASLKKIRDFKYLVRLEVNVWYTYIKLFPAPLILLNIPFIFLKYLFIIFGSILTGRIRIANIYSIALYRVLTVHRRQILSNRHVFFQRNVIQPVLAARHQDFFLVKYFTYFNKYCIQRRPSIYD